MSVFTQQHTLGFLFLFVFTNLITSNGAAQSVLSEQFTDGDFTTNPAWQGDVDKFAVIDERLRLQDTSPVATNLTYLSTAAATSMTQETVFEAFVNLDFSPSASNNARVYLSASTANLDEPLNGYFLEIGGISGDEDAVRLFRQDQNDSEELLSSVAGIVGVGPVQVFLRVTRTPQGVWTLETDTGMGLTNHGSVSDATYAQGNYFGWTCQYTATRSTAFGLDSIRVDPLFVDRSGPEIDTLFNPTPITVTVQFNEPILQTGLSTNQFNLTPTGTTITDITPISANALTLTLDNPLLNNQVYVLTADTIEDLAGNATPTQTSSFTALVFGTATVGNILFSEIMADPRPAIGLPDVEYLELYNASSSTLRLQEVTLQIGSSTRNLPAYNLPPQSYVLLVDEDDLSLFTQTNVVGISLPNLTDGGTTLNLVNDSGGIIDQVPYTNDWYQDDDRNDGGYSLERINLTAPCLLAVNWRASQNLVGGTPGAQNSVNDPTFGNSFSLNLTGLSLDSLDVLKLPVSFDQQLSATGNTDNFAFLLSGNSSIISANVSAENNRTLVLEYDLPFDIGVPYELTFSEPIVTCDGSTFEITDTLIVGKAKTPAIGDLQINELLFNPSSGGADFIELYNTTDLLLDISSLTFGNIQPGIDTSLASPETAIAIRPNSLLVLTSDPQSLMRYPSTDFTKVATSPLPSLDDDEGNLTIFRVDGDSIIIYESVNYSNDWHHPQLDDENGVSLERISRDAAIQDENNWTSASSSVNFASPTQENSQQRATTTTTSSNGFEVVSTRFSPNLDGFQDELIITYNFPEGEWLVTANAYSAGGIRVNEWLKNNLIGRQGFLKWSGTDDQGTLLAPDLYHLVIEALSTEGESIQFRKTVTLLPN